MRDTIHGMAGGPARATQRAWWPVAILSLLIAAYGAMFVARGEASFAAELAESFRARPLLIFAHAAFGTLALLTGPFQFRRGLRARRPRLHRVTGRIFVASALGTGVTGLPMSMYSFGGANTHVAFGVLALLTVATTGLGLARILVGDVAGHRAWMLRSFALIFAGVTLRLELPFLIAAFGGDFEPAYQVVAWSSWVPNLAWAEWRVRRVSVRPETQSLRAAA